MKKWQLWPKNVITQIFQRPYIFISILVVGYQSAACKGLCCQLTKPCQKPQPQTGRSNALEYATRDQYEIPRSQINLIKKLGMVSNKMVSLLTIFGHKHFKQKNYLKILYFDIWKYFKIFCNICCD